MQPSLKEVLSPKVQRKERPTIEKMCGYLITDPVFKGGLDNILSLLTERGAKVSWYQPCNYKVKYKGVEICQLLFGRGDNPDWWKWNEFVPNWLRVATGHEATAMVVEGPECEIELLKAFFVDKFDMIDTKNSKLEKSAGKPLSKLDKYLAEMPECEKKQNIVKLTAFLKGNKMTPQLFSPNSYKASYKKQRLCYIRFSGSFDGEFNWDVQFVRDGYGRDGYGRGEYAEPFNFDRFIENDALKKFLLSGLKQCCGCYECKPGMPIRISEKDYHMCIINFQNPDVKGVDNLIQIIECWKNDIDSR